MDQVQTIDFYWRPGCGFCMSLERGLLAEGFSLTKHNIWEDANAAAHVRSAANGNETVPTVTVGTTSLVNPRTAEVAELVGHQAPHLLPVASGSDDS